MARAVSMMGSGIFGANTILVGTGLSFDPGSRLGLRLEQHVGGASDGDELARAVADAGLAEGDGTAAAQEASLGDQVAVASLFHEDTQKAPEEVVLGALAGDDQQVRWHGGLVIPKTRAGLNREPRW